MDRQAGGKHWRLRSSIPLSTTVATRHVPIRSTSAPTPWSTFTRTRTLITTRGPSIRFSGPAHRNYLGHISSTLEDVNRLELVLGTKSRSGQQWDIWEAVYSPLGPDGYPRRIWDKRTGVIDHEVAKYWREHYDLGHILERDWPMIGKHLEGKINIYVGDMDNYYLNNAVYLVEEILKKVADPPFGGEILYGDRAEHCWNGDPNSPMPSVACVIIRCTHPRLWTGF